MLSYCLKCKKNTESINPKVSKTTNGKAIKYKMNNTVNKLLLAGDKFMPEIHLRQPQFTYSACGPYTKHEQRIQKFRETGDTNYIYKNELDKACFVHDAAYSDSKDLTKRIVPDKILKNKVFDIPKDPKHDGYQRGLASMVYKFFDSKVASPDKKSVGSGAKHVNTKITFSK